MPRHHFHLVPASPQPTAVRVWFDIYWGRLHWVARLRGAGGQSALRGSVITSMPRTFLALLRGLVEQEIRAAAAAAVKAPAAMAAPARTARQVPPPPAAWAVKRTLAHPPMPPDAPHGIWWPHPESWYRPARVRTARPGPARPGWAAARGAMGMRP